VDITNDGLDMKENVIFDLIRRFLFKIHQKYIQNTFKK